MTDFVLYALIDGEWAISAEFPNRERYFESIERYFAMKAAEGKEQEPADVVLELMCVPTVVAKGKFGLVKRGLRNHDEIGISAELVDAIDEAKANGATAVGWGATAEELAGMAPHDFGDLAI